MRNLKKILALVLALVMSFSLMATANAFTDSDKINGTYEEAVEVLSALKVFQGYENGSFVPQGSITRAEVAAIIYRIVTGDVADKQVGIYADYNKFNDVKSTSWYAGYVNFCANAEYIKGYDAKTFGPNDPVTGYQALAMILRAVGYDKNGEFTGTGWQTQTAAVGKKLGITNNVSEGTLGVAATREVVAEILFRTIMVPQVEYTVAFGYQSIGQVSIGYETFGLAYAEGIVTGNQATGAAATVVSKDYVANTTTDLRFGTKTDLNMIGHSVKVWYDARTSAVANGVYGTVYTLMDKSTAETVLTASELVGKVDSKTAYSYNYGAFNKGAYNPAASKFVVIDGGKAVISVNELAAAIFAVNNYAVTPTVTLTVGKEVAQAGADTRVYKQSVLTGYDKDTMTVGKRVILTQIEGKELYNLQLIDKTVKGVIRYYDAQGNVTLSDGTVLSRSGANLYASAGNVGIHQDVAFNTLKTYVFTLDADGRYIGSQEVGSDYLFGTYAYYTIDNAATAQLSYYLTGVTADGQVVTKKISSTDYNGIIKGSGIPTLTTAGQEIANPGNSGKDFSLTETAVTDILKVANSAFGPNTNPTSIAQINGGDATIQKNTVTIGTSHNYFVDENTKFYFISGTAAQPQVQEVVGKTALLGSGDVYVLPASSVITTSVLSYSVSTAANLHVDTVLVKAPYAANAASDLYYLNKNDKFDLGITDGTFHQIGVHKNAKTFSPVWVAVKPVLNNQNAFFTHTANAAGIETLTKVDEAQNATNAIKAYYRAKTVAAGSYDLYITDTKGNYNKVASDAVVVDLRPGVSGGNYTAGQGLLIEVKTVADLILQSGEYEFTVDAAGTAGGINIIYVTSSKILDKYAQFNVNFKATKNGVEQKPATDYYTVVEGSEKLPYGGHIYFTLKGAAKGAIVMIDDAPANLVNKWVGNVWMPVYAIEGVVAHHNVEIVLPYTTATVNGIVTDVVVNNVHLGAPKFAYSDLKEALAKAEVANLADQLAISPTSNITVTTKDGVTISGMSIGAYRTAPASIATPVAVEKTLTDASLMVGDYIVITEVYNGVTYYMAYIVK